MSSGKVRRHLKLQGAYGCRNARIPPYRNAFLSFHMSARPSNPRLNFHLTRESDPKRALLTLSKSSRIYIIRSKISLKRNIIRSCETEPARLLRVFTGFWRTHKPNVKLDLPRGPNTRAGTTKHYGRLVWNSGDLRWWASSWLAFWTREKIACSKWHCKAQMLCPRSDTRAMLCHVYDERRAENCIPKWMHGRSPRCWLRWEISRKYSLSSKTSLERGKIISWNEIDSLSRLRRFSHALFRKLRIPAEFAAVDYRRSNFPVHSRENSVDSIGSLQVSSILRGAHHRRIARWECRRELANVVASLVQSFGQRVLSRDKSPWRICAGCTKTSITCSHNRLQCR